jgi:hypothetical protein
MLKKKPICRATHARFKREKRCFEEEHLKALEAYAIQASGLGERIAYLEAQLKGLSESSVGKDLAEEQEKTAFHNGLHEGQKETEETHRKEKRCFDKMHGFLEGKIPMNLNFGEVIGMFANLCADPMSGGISARVTVMVPVGMNVPRMSLQQSLMSARDMFKSAKVTIVKEEEKEKGAP